MKKICLFFLIVFICFSGYIFSKPKYIIKFASVAPEGSTWMNVMEELNDTIMRKTNGEVKFKFYPGGVSGDEKDVLKKMKINQLHGAGFTSQGLGIIVPEVRILNLPLIFKNYDEVDYIMEKISPYLEKKFEKKGYIVLGWPEVGFVYVFSKKKIESINDLRKLKMWIWGDDVLVNTLFKNIGIVPIPLSLIDVMQSLQTGLIEGVYCSPLSAIALQWYTQVKYMLNLKIADVPGGVLITKRMWKKIPKKYQKIILKESKKSFRKLTELSRKENEESLKVLKKQGIVFTNVREEDEKIFKDISIKTANNLAGKFYSKKLLKEMLDYLEEYRKSKIKKEKKSENIKKN